MTLLTTVGKIDIKKILVAGIFWCSQHCHGDAGIDWNICWLPVFGIPIIRKLHAGPKVIRQALSGRIFHYFELRNMGCVEEISAREWVLHLKAYTHNFEKVYKILKLMYPLCSLADVMLTTIIQSQSIVCSTSYTVYECTVLHLLKIMTYHVTYISHCWAVCTHLHGFMFKYIYTLTSFYVIPIDLNILVSVVSGMLIKFSQALQQYFKCIISDICRIGSAWMGKKLGK